MNCSNRIKDLSICALICMITCVSKISEITTRLKNTRGILAQLIYTIYTIYICGIPLRELSIDNEISVICIDLMIIALQFIILLNRSDRNYRVVSSDCLALMVDKKAASSGCQTYCIYKVSVASSGYLACKTRSSAVSSDCEHCTSSKVMNIGNKLNCVRMNRTLLTNYLMRPSFYA